MVKRILFIINRSSATGHGDATINRLCAILRDAIGHEMDVHVEVVTDHPQAKAQTKAFLAASDAPAFIIVGGGGGTLRAVIEGVCDGSAPGALPGQERVQIAALRMGSGNIVAKQFGVPLEPETALEGIMANFQKHRTAPCCVMRCEVGVKDSRPVICYATAMAGFGQFGRSPGDLARWHHRLPTLRKLAAGLFGIERLNTIEYALSLFLRFAWCALWPNAAEVVEVRVGERTESIRLLAGVIMNFPFKAMPFETEVRVEDMALSLHFIPYPGRWGCLLPMLSLRRFARKALQLRLENSDGVEIGLAGRDAVEFFLDEDPVVFNGKVWIQVAGALAFVPGPDYHWPQERKERLP